MPFEVLSIAARALAAQQLALEVTGNNMANATTPGYRKETANTTEMAPSPDAAEPGTIIGNGVEVTSVTRASNAFLSRSVRTQTSLSGQWSAINQGLTQVQNVFQEPSSAGLSETMSAFFKSFQSLSQNPEDLATRQGVIQDGETLAQTFNQMATTLGNQMQSVNQNVGDDITQINQIAHQISQLNQQIATISTSNQPANDLLDQRGALVDKLSKLVNVSYAPGPAESLDVYIGSHPLVTGSATYAITASQNNAGQFSPTWADNGQAVQAQSGDMAGNLTLLNTYLPNYLNQLNTLAKSLADQVNTLQESGYGSQGTSTNGIPFFTYNSGGAAGSLAVNVTQPSGSTTPVLTPDTIGAAASANSPGDGSQALAMANLQNQTLSISGSNTTFNGAYASLVGQVGSDGQNATNQTSQTQSSLTSLKNGLQSETGVDVNQQSVMMIQEEQSYTAAAKMVTAEQSIINSLLQAVG